MQGCVGVVARAGVIVGLAGLAAGGQPLVAQEPSVAMEVDTTLIHVGDPVSVLLHVDHPRGWAVQWADSVAVSPFEVLRYERLAPVAAPAGDGMRSTAKLVITSFELGELEIPPVAVSVAAPDGTVETLLTDPFRIGVESVGLDESGDIRDIKGPLSIARSWWGVLLWPALAAAAGAGIVYYRRRWGSRPAAVAAELPPPARPFHVLALEALDALEASSLLERGKVKTYHVRISEIIRSYVEGQLEVPAMELTTPEVVDGLRRASLGDEIPERFRVFLERCDLVKFAKLRPGAGESRVLLATARSLVEMTSVKAAHGESAREFQPVAAEATTPAEAATPAESAAGAVS